MMDRERTVYANEAAWPGAWPAARVVNTMFIHHFPLPATQKFPGAILFQMVPSPAS